MQLSFFFILAFLFFGLCPTSAQAQSAQDDWLEVPQGLRYRLPVFENDTGYTAANLHSFSQPAQGQLQAQNGELYYTAPNSPSSAQFQYVLCTTGGICDTALVYLNSQTVILETAYTQRHQAVYLQEQLYHQPPYNLVQAPQNGTVSIHSGDFRYLPNWNFTGTDSLLLQRNSSSSQNNFVLYEIQVLQQLPLLGNHDYVQTPANQSLQIQPLGNDLGQGLHIHNLGLPQNGQAVLDANFPIISYSPDSNFVGLDQFDYTLCDAQGMCQEVQIFVQVGPGQHWLQRSVGQNSALYEDFGAQITTFHIVNPPLNGQIYQAFDTTLDHGVQTRYYAALLQYQPQPSYTGMDYAQVAACASGQCDTFNLALEIIPTHNCTDCVWPGDANNDGLVDAFDLLTLGSAYGANGMVRSNAHLGWQGQPVSDWSGSINGYPGLNYKYADANGDGLINEKDTLAVHQNYGLRSKNQLTQQAPLSAPEVQLLPVGQAVPHSSGGLYQEFEIWVNNPNGLGLHGLYLQFQFDTSAVLLDSLRAAMLPNNFLSQGSYMLSLLKKHGNGQVDLAYTRTNSMAVAAAGLLGNIGVVITDNIDGRIRPEDLIFKLEHSIAIDDQGRRLELGSSLVSAITEVAEEEQQRRILIYPQPASDFLNIQSLDGLELQEIELYDLQGRRVHAENLNNQTQKTLSTSALPAGMYLLRLYSEAGTLTQKVVVGN